MTSANDCSNTDWRKTQYPSTREGGQATLSANRSHDLNAVRMASSEHCGEYRQSFHLIRTIAMRRRTKIILAVVGVAIVWPFAQIGLIAAQAQYFANGRPYCIETSGNRSLLYKPVGSLLELNGFALRAPFVNTGNPIGSGSGSHGAIQSNFHALLVVDTGSIPERRNWSYWNLHFDQLTPQQAKDNLLYEVDCQPKVDFVFELPLFAK